MAKVEKLEDGIEVIEFIDVENNTLEVATNIDGLLISFYGTPILSKEQVSEIVQHLCHWLETDSLDYMEDNDELAKA
uniref:Uncharacterized protein n=1 Tax=viral metagenome TaxID=1070528 RepID=A0A6M3JR46_9ZZZZ